MKQYKEGRENGFTLIEILVTVIMVGILSSIAIPIFNVQKKKAIHASLVADVKNAGFVMQDALIFSDDPYSMLLPNFFVSQDTNVIQVNHMQSSADFFCIIGTNETYPDMFVYFDSAKGGMLNDPEACGQSSKAEGNQSDPQNSNTYPNPTPAPTGAVQNESQTRPQPGDANYIPPEIQFAMNTPFPNNQCQAKVTEHIEAYAALYASLKYQNLVSVMARLQSDNKEIADILKNTVEGKRAIEASRAIERDPVCSNYVSIRTTATSYYFDDYDEMTKAYIEFMNNLTETSADTYAYVKAYKKLYYRVYGLSP